MADKIKKLSEAIRLGATFRPKGVHRCLMDGKTCALGAALDAVGLLERRNLTGDGGVTQDTWETLWERFPVPAGVQRQITDRNDHQGQTREEIADWLEAQGL